MNQEIQKALAKMEAEKEVKILFACESGSRAWGFHSPDSDYDVRFAYIHKKSHYLEIEDKKDFIEFPKDEILDIVGYDIRKLLKLFRGSNAKIFEWIQSPIMYRADEVFLSTLTTIKNDFFSPKAGLHHYLGLTKSTMELYLRQDKVRLKKYFYALRPILAAKWIVKNHNCPPMEFSKLRVMVEEKSVQTRIDELLEQKAGVGEGFMISKDAFLNEYIEDQGALAEGHARTLGTLESDVQPLNDLFKKMLDINDHSGA